MDLMIKKGLVIKMKTILKDCPDYNICRHIYNTRLAPIPFTCERCVAYHCYRIGLKEGSQMKLMQEEDHIEK